MPPLRGWSQHRRWPSSSPCGRSTCWEKGSAMRSIRTRLRPLLRAKAATFLAAALGAGALALLAAPFGCAGALTAPFPSADGPENAPRRGGELHLAWLQD